MALATTEHHASAPRQHASPGVAQQGAQMQPPKEAAPAAAEPVLVEGIDPVLLHRLYPDADSTADAAARAMAQGKKTAEESAKAVAAQQEPVT